MKVLHINLIRPQEGSGDGITEYAYQLRSCLSKTEGVSVEEIHAVGNSRKMNVRGLLYANTLFRLKIMGLAGSDYDIIHITNQEIGFAAGILRGCGFKGKIITTIHDLIRIDGTSMRGIAQGIYSGIVKNSIVSSLRNSDYLIFDSAQTEREVKRFTTHAPYEIIPLGVKTGFIAAPLKRKGKRGKYIIGYVGSLSQNKNVGMVLRAAEACKEDAGFEFRIWGAGEENDILRAYAARKGLKNTRFEGFAPEAKKRDIYDSFDLFMFPSFHEGFGLPILEAQARGLPVIIYKKGKITEEVRRYCFEADNPKQMVDLITEIKDSGYEPKPRKRALEYARSFRWEKTAIETLQIYRKVLTK